MTATESEGVGRDVTGWGWDEGWSEAWLEAGPAPPGRAAAPEPSAPECRPARVVREHRDRWEVAVADDGIAPATLAPSVPRPAVGDWVAVREGGPDETLLVTAVLPRRSRFSRGAAGEEGGEQVVAANVDAVWIVHGLDLEVNPRRLERYVTLGWESGAQPVVVLTKADAGADPEASRVQAEAVAPGVPVRVVSARDEGGLAELEPDLVPGRTVALLGPSGAGKSTLVNALLGADLLRTGEVRTGDRKGRHTTTHRELVRLPGGPLLLDTPGMRELQLWDVGEGLDLAFADVAALAAGCRFSDCVHDAEPGCAVKAAVAAGRLDAARVEGYHKLRAEAAWQARKSDPRARKAEERRVASLHRTLDVHLKRKDP